MLCSKTFSNELFRRRYGHGNGHGFHPLCLSKDCIDCLLIPDTDSVTRKCVLTIVIWIVIKSTRTKRYLTVLSLPVSLFYVIVVVLMAFVLPYLECAQSSSVVWNPPVNTLSADDGPLRRHHSHNHPPPQSTKFFSCDFRKAFKVAT